MIALDAHLPHPHRGYGPDGGLSALTGMGLVLIMPIVVAFLLTGPEYSARIRAGWGLASSACAR